MQLQAARRLTYESWCDDGQCQRVTEHEAGQCQEHLGSADPAVVRDKGGQFAG
jgi:hypothetical protein